MANIEIQNNDVVGLVVWDPVYADDVVGDFVSAQTYAKGTILRREYTTAGSPANGVLTVFAENAIDPNVAIPFEEMPVAILIQDTDVPHQTAPGDEIPVRVLIGGRLRASNLLSVDNPSELNPLVKYLLKQNGFFALETKELAELDNQ